MKITNTKSYKNINYIKTLRSEPREGEDYFVYVGVVSLQSEHYDILFTKKQTKSKIITDTENYQFYIPIKKEEGYYEFIERFISVTIEGNLGTKYIKDFLPNLIITKEDYLKLTDTSEYYVEIALNFNDYAQPIKDTLELGINSGHMSFHDGKGQGLDIKKGEFGNIDTPMKTVEVYEPQGNKNVLKEKYISEVKEHYSEQNGYIYDYEA